MNLKNLSNQDLLSRTSELVSQERRVSVEVLHHLREIEYRKLHLQCGYSSLFVFAMRELKYSESEAYRRIEAMKLLKDNPQIEEKIRRGSISVTAAAQAQTFFKSTLKQGQPLLPEVKMKILEKIENKSTREVEQEFARLNPSTKPRIEKVKPISAERFEMKITISVELKEKLDSLKAFLSHSLPQATYEEIIEKCADLLLEKKDPSRIKQRSVSLARKPTARSRYIARSIQRRVWQRDQGKCSFIDPKTQVQCGSRHFLQIDHIYPFRLGGGNTETNLRLLCAAHNQAKG